MKIVTIILSVICRLGTEFGMPILAFFVFSLPVAIAILVAFLTWQLVSALYLTPIYQKQLEERKQSEIDFAVDRVKRYYRMELIGRLPAPVRVEIDENVEKALAPVTE